MKKLQLFYLLALMGFQMLVLSATSNVEIPFARTEIAAAEQIIASRAQSAVNAPLPQFFQAYAAEKKDDDTIASTGAAPSAIAVAVSEPTPSQSPAPSASPEPTANPSPGTDPTSTPSPSPASTPPATAEPTPSAVPSPAAGPVIPSPSPSPSVQPQPTALPDQPTATAVPIIPAVTSPSPTPTPAQTELDDFLETAVGGITETDAVKQQEVEQTPMQAISSKINDALSKPLDEVPADIASMIKSLTSSKESVDEPVALPAGVEERSPQSSYSYSSPLSTKVNVLLSTIIVNVLLGAGYLAKPWELIR